MKGGVKGTMDYITCARRKNAPKLNVLICEKKCEHAETCKPYLNYLQEQSSKASLSECNPEVEEMLTVESPPIKKIPSLVVGK
ncbi:MAG: hypothetical protein JRI87_02040 [Deltaproteobacteria bacterium]|jgi:hypothetical protein|nr:hypothetical protein [Deltaproteobacteria bacterium]